MPACKAPWGNSPECVWQRSEAIPWRENRSPLKTLNPAMNDELRRPSLQGARMSDEQRVMVLRSNGAVTVRCCAPLETAVRARRTLELFKGSGSPNSAGGQGSGGVSE
ncbi:hypothetical protein AAFF_G00342120 [Aldrovandia affinis]|uniref:Uncharacterized protein n=1 Tax=Aldrovandia affinis TaxID=143900 RepID=A0AAD7VZW8_9TELE|nr:hypothetical protein AAFF_G00342120 [Aldrovandia affinis]